MAATLLTRDEVVALRDQAKAGHWDNVAGVRLLQEAERVVWPVLRRTARRYRVPVQELTGTTMVAAWQALCRYDPAKSPDPWGWVAATARRVAGDAAVVASTGHTARGRARLAVALEATCRQLTAQLGRLPDEGELLVALRPNQRTLAARIVTDGDLAAFIGVGSPMLTYDDAILDRPAASEPSAPLARCPRLTALAEWLAVEVGLSVGHVEALLELASDLAGDFIPTLGIAEAVPRIVDELTRAPISAPLTAETARHLVESLLSHAALASAGPEPAAA